MTRIDARSGKLASGIFLIVGLGLLAGAGAAYYYIVQRPLTWPRVDAVVVASRVVNPHGPSQYQPEIVFRYELDGAAQETPIVASWSSSSYDAVRSHVDRYPAGASVPLAINPSDSSDVRYEIGPTFVNLIVPGALGTLGGIFALTAVLARRLQRADSPPAVNTRVLRRVATTFSIIGVVLFATGGWLTAQNAAMLREWPTVDGEVVDAAIVTRSSSARGSGSTTRLYDVQVTFAYVVSGQRFESATTTGIASSSRDRVASLLQTYRRGTHHPIRHRPDDPNVIRFDVSRLSIFATAGGLVFMGLIFLGFGLTFLKFGPKSP